MLLFSILSVGHQVVQRLMELEEKVVDLAVDVPVAVDLQVICGQILSLDPFNCSVSVDVDDPVSVVHKGIDNVVGGGLLEQPCVGLLIAPVISGEDIGN